MDEFDDLQKRQHEEVGWVHELRAIWLAVNNRAFDCLYTWWQVIIWVYQVIQNRWVFVCEKQVLSFLLTWFAALFCCETKGEMQNWLETRQRWIKSDINDHDDDQNFATLNGLYFCCAVPRCTNTTDTLHTAGNNNNNNHRWTECGGGGGSGGAGDDDVSGFVCKGIKKELNGPSNEFK